MLWYAYQSLPYPSNQVNWAGTYLVRSLCILPPAYLPFYRKANPSLPVLGLILLHVLPLSLAFKFDHLVVSTFFFSFLFFPPSFSPFPLSPRLPFLFLPFCFLCLGSGPCCDRTLFRNLILSSSPIFFDFAAPLRFLDLDGASLGVSIWDENLVQFHSII